MENRPIHLNQLQAGERARISRIHGHPDHVHRLEEFGLHSGTCIEMFRRGNPCIIRMAGNKICFRADDGLTISVVPIGGSIRTDDRLHGHVDIPFGPTL